MDTAAIPACIIHTGNNDMIRHQTDNRRLFLRITADTLRLPAIQDWLQNAGQLGNRKYTK